MLCGVVDVRRKKDESNRYMYLLQLFVWRMARLARCLASGQRIETFCACLSATDEPKSAKFSNLTERIREQARTFSNHPPTLFGDWLSGSTQPHNVFRLSLSFSSHSCRRSCVEARKRQDSSSVRYFSECRMKSLAAHAGVDVQTDMTQ